jgi:hypothetical protein
MTQRLLALPLVLGATVIAACGESSEAGSAVLVDSLPGGIPRTMSSAPIERGQWSLVHVRDIQPGELDPAELIQPQDLAIAGDGSVIVAESRPAHVKVYGPDGAFIHAIGREGSGPGEFRSAYVAVLGDTLVVQDPQNARATTFNWRTAELLSERRTTCCYYFPIGIDASGRAVARALQAAPDSTLPNPQAFVRFPINGSSADTLTVSAGSRGVDPKLWLVREGDRIRFASQVPLSPRPNYLADPRGGFVTGFSSEYMLRRTSNGLDTASVFGRSWTTTSVSADEKAQIVEERVAEVRQTAGSGVAGSAIRAAFDPAMIPDARPAWDAFWVDAGGRTWVRVGTSDTTVVEFDLFYERGRWLDVLRIDAHGWPRSTWASLALGRDRAAVILEGEDGRPLVRVYSIERR